MHSPDVIGIGLASIGFTKDRLLSWRTEHQMDRREVKYASSKPKKGTEVIVVFGVRGKSDELMSEEEHLGERVWNEMSSELDYLQLGQK